MRPKIGQAIENALSISYEHYKSQVVSYLKKEYHDYYGTKSYWNSIQKKLIFSLEKIKITSALP